MKYITVKGIFLMYSSIRNSIDNEYFTASIEKFMKNRKGTFLIILNDSSNETFIEIIEKLNLPNSNEIILGCLKNASKYNSSWMQLYSRKINNFNSDVNSCNNFLLKIIKELNLKPHEIITIGENQEHLKLSRNSLMHFHVGKKSVLDKKIRRTIPLYEQFEFGVCNIISYFTANAFNDKAIDYNDLIGFIQNSIDYYNQENAAELELEMHNNACNILLEKFGNNIAGIFGVGYPFYLMKNDKLHKESSITPKSILDYLEIQLEYFSKKVTTDSIFDKNRNKRFLVKEVEKSLGIKLGRNKFDSYKYIKLNHKPPTLNKDNLSLQEYYEETCFDINHDIWPCYYCSKLQWNDLYPKQNVIKDTRTVCLSCKQTSFMLRNITGCSTDIDVIVVVNKEKERFAKLIKEFIANESEYYVYDTDFHRTMKNKNDGPIDIFVTEVKDIIKSFPKLLSNQWTTASFPCVAMWSQTIYDLQFNIGEDFPLAFEPRVLINDDLLYSFNKARKDFAQFHDIETVLMQLYNHSLEREQILENSFIVQNIKDRLKSWKGISLSKLSPINYLNL